MSDDRFSPDSLVYRRPESEEDISAFEYFTRAFRAGQQDHPRVRKLAEVLPGVYIAAETAYREEVDAQASKNP